jgi:hypothetical protein
MATISITRRRGSHKDSTVLQAALRLRIEHRNLAVALPQLYIVAINNTPLPKLRPAPYTAARSVQPAHVGCC